MAAFGLTHPTTHASFQTYMKACKPRAATDRLVNRALFTGLISISSEQD
jgi:hypothetical protein